LREELFKVKFKNDMIGRHGEDAVSASFYQLLLDWCSDNCKGGWKESQSWRIFEFVLEEDAILFKLIFGG
jgi:hypothetical protein